MDRQIPVELVYFILFYLYFTDSLCTSHRDVHVYSAYLVVLDADYLRSVFICSAFKAVVWCTFTLINSADAFIHSKLQIKPNTIQPYS